MMNPTLGIAVWIGAQTLVVTLLWFGALAILRKVNFKDDGNRIGDPRDATPDTLVKQIEYHNKASYGAFEFFLKIALAVLAGMAYVAIQPSRTAAANVLVRSGAWLLLLAAVVFCIVIFIHQKSKIERWPRRYTLPASLLWSEYWLIQGMLLVAVGMFRWVLPHLSSAGA